MKFTNAYHATFARDAAKWDFLMLPEISEIVEVRDHWYFRSSLSVEKMAQFTESLSLIADEVFAEVSGDKLRPKRQLLRSVNSMSVVPDAIQLAESYGAKLPEQRR